MKRKALFIALSGKAAGNQLMVLDGISISEPKTKQASQILNVLTGKLENYKAGKKKRDSLLLVVNRKEQNLAKSAGNLSFVKLLNAKDLNVLDVLSHKFLLMDQSSVPTLKDNFKV